MYNGVDIDGIFIYGGYLMEMVCDCKWVIEFILECIF